MANIQVFGTGGTIASRGRGEDGVLASDSANSLVQSVSSVHTVASHDILTTGSYRLNLNNLRTVAEFVRNSLDDDDVDGVVVTHGTDTMEETAFLLDLVHSSRKNVVFTGAQHAADSRDPDGPRNLADAVTAAACEDLHGSGALIAFSGVVRSARGARKFHTTALNPFAGGCEVAHMIGDDLVVMCRPIARKPLPLPPPRFDTTRVEIITTFPGATTDLFDFAVRSGTDAVVLAGSGVGNAGPGFLKAVEKSVERGCPVILSTRTPWGPVVPTYGNGGGIDLVKAGAIPSGDLNPFQARILAALLMSLDTPLSDFSTFFQSTASPSLVQ